MAEAFKSTRDFIIKVPDMGTARRFYADVMGFKPTLQTEGCAGFETGSFQLFVEQGTQPEPVFEYLVPDVDAAKRKLLAAGCRVVEDDPRVPRLYMRDPYGLTFNLARR